MSPLTSRTLSVLSMIVGVVALLASIGPCVFIAILGASYPPLWLIPIAIGVLLSLTGVLGLVGLRLSRAEPMSRWAIGTPAIGLGIGCVLLALAVAGLLGGVGMLDSRPTIDTSAIGRSCVYGVSGTCPERNFCWVTAPGGPTCQIGCSNDAGCPDGMSCAELHCVSR